MAATLTPQFRCTRLSVESVPDPDSTNTNRSQQMKRILFLALAIFLSIAATSPGQNESPAAKANALYRQGVLAMKQGQVETARACFEGVLRLQPNNINARYQLKQLSLQGDRLAAKRRELKMKSITLPKVEFDELTLREALDAINTMVEKETKGEFVPNFVVEDPEGALDERTFTLKLGRIPAAVALNYALESTGATARYDQHAIVIRARGKGTGADRGEAPAEDDEDQALQRRARDPFDR